MNKLRDYFTRQSEENATWRDLEMLETDTWYIDLLPGVDFKKLPTGVHNVMDFIMILKPRTVIRRHHHDEFTEIFTAETGMFCDNVSGITLEAGKRTKFRPGTPHEIENVAPGGVMSRARAQLVKR